MSAPPRLPSWILRRLPTDVLGDLEEAFRRRSRADGPRARMRAAMWYRFQVARLLVGLAFLPGGGRGRRPARFDALLQDLRFALRSLVRRPALSVVVVCTLAVVIGANATIFSLINSLFFGSTLVHEPDRVVEIYASRERDANVGGFQGFLPLSYPNAADVGDLATSLEGSYAYTIWPVSVELGDEPERSQAMYVSAEYFDVLGVPAHLGRTFRSEEDDSPGAAPVAVVSYGLWQERFGGDPSALGTTFRMNARAYTVVGVAPYGFRGTSTTIGTDIWVPVSMIVDVPVWGELFENRGARFFFMGARMAEGRTLAQTEAELHAVWERLAEAHPRLNAASGLQLLPLPEARVNPNVRGVVAGASAVLMGVVGVLLLIACMNVANVLLARALGRTREMAIRTSVGAGRGRLLAQLLTESTVLFGLGGISGLAVALWGQQAITGLQPPALFGATLEVHTDLRVLGFTAAIAIGCGLLFGLIPAWRAARTDVASQLRDGDRGTSSRGHGIRNALVGGQVALALLALIGAGLFLKSLEQAARVPLGFEPQNLALLSVDLGAQGYTEAEGRVYYREAIRAAESVAGVRSAAVGSLRPLSFGPLRTLFRPDENPDDPQAGTMVREHLVSEGYLSTAGVPLVRGRDLNAGDGPEAAPVALVNQRLAELFWPGQDPLGKQFRISIPPTEVTVVGVVADGKYITVSEDPQPAYFRPTEQEFSPTPTIFVRTEPGAHALDHVRQAVQGVDPSMPVFDVMPASGLVDRALWNTRALTALLGAFGLLGLVLAAVGIYGVVAGSVRERTREIGLRMALGASRPSLVRTVVRQVATVTGIGVAVGLLLALTLTRPLASQLMGVSPRDPATYATTSLVFFVVALVAAYLPARRATAVDPSSALAVD